MSGDLDKIVSEPETIKDEQIAKIEGDLQSEKDDRKQERFIWVFALILIADFYVFRDISPWFSPVVLVLELIFLILLGNFCGVDQVYTVTQNAIDAVVKLRMGRK